MDLRSGTIGDLALRPGWQGFPLMSALRAAFNLPVAIENDCDAAALAEATWGSGHDLSRFLFVSISTGMAQALYSKGKFIAGQTAPALSPAT